MNIGFTGTRTGMTLQQMATVQRLIVELKGTSISHGDCLGADAEFSKLAKDAGIIYGNHIIHPPSDDKHRAHCFGVTRREKTYLVRNRNIVDSCDIMLATPNGAERLRSGTWSTIRYAKKVGKNVLIIKPDGTV